MTFEGELMNLQKYEEQLKSRGTLDVAYYVTKGKHTRKDNIFYSLKQMFEQIQN